MFYLPDNIPVATTYRWVFTELNAMVGLFAMLNPFFITDAECDTDEEIARDDCLLIPRSELGWVWWKLKGREGVKGAVQLCSYDIRSKEDSPVSWVLEGLTAEY